MASENTLLRLEFGVTDYSVRGLTQSLRHIDEAVKMRRTVRGDLRDISRTEFRKYASTITCRDQDVPALSGIWPGMIINVSCIVELCFETVTGGMERTPVSGSERVEGDYTFYRPRLRMMIVSYSVDKDEWNATVGWTLELQEV
jgi:hypothetical protein